VNEIGEMVSDVAPAVVHASVVDAPDTVELGDAVNEVIVGGAVLYAYNAATELEDNA
jgi:hypothetical protein